MPTLDRRREAGPMTCWCWGMVAAGLLWAGLFVAVPSDHDARDGIVGDPAFLNYSEPREKILIIAAHVLPVAVCGLIAVLTARWAKRSIEGACGPAAGANVPELQVRWFSRPAFLCPIISFAIFVVFKLVAEYDTPFDSFHEGCRLNYAAAALRGMRPYRDYDCVYGLWYGVYQHLLAFRLFGDVSVQAARSFGHWLAPLFPVSIYFVCWSACRRQLEALIGVGLATLLIFAHPILNGWPVDSTAFTSRHAWPALLIGLLLVFLESRSRVVLFVAGIAGAIAWLWPIQSALVPLFATLGTFVVLAVTRGWGPRAALKSAAIYHTGLLLGLTPLVYYLASNDMFGPFVGYHAKVLRIHASWNGLPFPWTPRDWGNQAPQVLAYLFFPLVLTSLTAGQLSIPLVRGIFTTERAKIACLAMSSFVSYYAGVADRSDWVHGAESSFLHIPLLLVLLQSALRNVGKFKFARMAVLAVRIGLLIGIGAASRYIVLLRIHNYGEPSPVRYSTSELRRIDGVPRWREPVSAITDELGKYVLRTTSSEQAILDLSDTFAAHFLFDRPSPGRIYFSYDGVARGDQEAMRAQLPATEIVIVPLRPTEPNGVTASARYHLIMEDVLEKYEPNFGYTGCVVVRRRGISDQTRPLSEWTKVMPRHERLRYLAFFGRELFGEAAPRDERYRMTSCIDASHHAIEGSADPATKSSGQSFELPVVENEESIRSLWIQVRFVGKPGATAVLRWTAENDTSTDGWSVDFNLVGSSEAREYVVKLSSLPQWVWARPKKRLRFELPAGAELISATWEQKPSADQ